MKHCWLKPQHKIKVIQKNVLPKAACVADLGDASNDSMQELDPKIRKCVRRILGLKKSVPDTYIHSRANDGGLGVRWTLDHVNMCKTARKS